MIYSYLFAFAMFLGLLVTGYRKAGARGLFVCLALGLSCVGLLSLFHYNLPDARFPMAIAISLSALDLVLLLKLDSFLQWMEKRWVTAGLALMFTFAIPLGVLEGTASFLTDIVGLNYFKPLLVTTGRAQEDWRAFHINVNTGVTADPVLLWQPRPFYPYNSQHMRGPRVETPKPKDVFRIMSYGDSNTDGPPEGGSWTEVLGKLTSGMTSSDSKRIEVLNAGVTGYTSHQGLMRFRQQVEAFNPDVIFVSFGWNDPSPAMNTPDKLFPKPNPVQAMTLKVLYRFRCFLLVKELFRQPSPPEQVIGSRVPLSDYEENLRAFATEAATHGAKVIFLTRPHRLTESELRNKDSWRNQVPQYNAALRSLAAKQSLTLLDVQSVFAKNPELFSDECHFTQAGHQRLADLLVKALKDQRLLN